MAVGEAPINARMIEDSDAEKKGAGYGKPRLPWIRWFQDLQQGDRGNGFVPIISGLGGVGTPVVAGAFYSNMGWTDFWIEIIPGTSTSSVAGVTYFELPVDVKVGAPNFATSGAVLIGAGAIDAGTNRIYTPAWTGVTQPITITGRVLTQ